MDRSKCYYKGKCKNRRWLCIGEGTLIKKDCLPFGVYAGRPAKLIRYRLDNDTIQQLIEIKWWNWSMKKILKNKNFFSTKLSTFNKPLKSLIV